MRNHIMRTDRTVVEVENGEVLISDNYIVDAYCPSGNGAAKNLTYYPNDSQGWGIQKRCSVHEVDAMTQADFEAFEKDAHSRIRWEPFL